MTLLELIEEVYEKTHVDRVEILSIVQESWGEKRESYSATQAALVVRALSRQKDAQYTTILPVVVQ